MTDRPELTADHYLDALALCRATLRNDDAGLIAIANSANVAMMMQALVRLHLQTLGVLAEGSAEHVDAFLGNSLAALSRDAQC